MLTWIWGVGNRVWIALLALIPGVNIVMAVILGLKGNDWAWQKNQVYSKTEFRRVQLLWAWWGVIVIPSLMIVGILLLMYTARELRKADQIEARDATRISNVKSIVAQVNNYKLDHKQACPVSLGDLIPRYLVQIPAGQANDRYGYQVKGEDCYVSIVLEDPKNIELQSDADPSNGQVFDQKSEDISHEIIWGEANQ